MTDRHAVVIGAGLGGLLSAAFLGKHGWRVTVLEQLGFIGGKFTQFDYQGFAVPTGAFHTLPGGESGHIMAALKRLDLSVATHPMPAILYVEKRGRLHPMYSRLKANLHHRDSMFRAFGPLDLIALYRMGRDLRRVRRLPPGTYRRTLAENLARFHVSAGAGRMLSKILEFSTAVPADVADMADLATFTRGHAGTTPCVLTGGCKSVIEALTRYVYGHGGTVRTEARVAGIAVRDGAARGVVLAGGTSISADLVVCCAGPQAAAKLLGQNCPPGLAQKATAAIPAWGVTHSLRANEHFLTHEAVEIPTALKRVAGYVEISRAAPALAPPGKAYLLAYQHLYPEEPVVGQLREGMTELRDRFGHLPGFAAFNVSTYRNGWPGARMQPRIGQTGADRFPVAVPGLARLLMLTDDNQGRGLAAEVIAEASGAFEEAVASL